MAISESTRALYWLHYGTRENKRWLPIHEIVRNVGIPISLPQNTTFFEFQLLHGLNLMIFDADFKSAKKNLWHHALWCHRLTLIFTKNK